jgi:tetratricopeptide (TPR) repeat protein
MTKKTIYILISIFVIVALHVWAAIYPSHANWGFHFFSFYSLPVVIAALIIFGLFSYKQTGSAIANRLDFFVKKISRLPLLIVFVLAAGIIFLFIYLYPAKLHLLGDGAVLLRSVPLGITGDQITLSFRNQPLMFWIYKTAMSLHPFEAAPNAHTVYYAIDIFTMVAYLALLFWFFRYVSQPLLEKIFLGGIVLFGAGFQFFFGYVENYVLQYFATTAYILTAWLALEKRIHVVIPIIFFITMVALHLGSIVFIPSLFALIFLLWKKKKVHAVIFLGIIIIAGVGALFLVGFNPIDMMKHLRSGSVDFLKPFEGGYGNFPYAMFSLKHIVDLGNAHLLLAPLGIILSIILIPALPKERRWNNPILLFFLITIGCGLFFTFVINSALGLARDWDLFSSFFVPLSILPVYLLIQQNQWKERRYIILLIAMFLLIRTSSFIGINASEEKHLTRARMLNSESFLSKAANMAYDESLANFFFDSQRFSDARIYYEHFMTIDSMNPRIIGNISDVYRRLGEKEKYFYQLKRAVVANSPDPGIYSNLGVEYATRGDTMKAIEYNERAIQLNSNSSRAHANLGILYSSRNNFVSADKHFRMAVDLGMREPLLFLYAGDCAVRLGDLQRALSNYDIYLSNNPRDDRVLTMRNKVYDYLSKGKK